MKIAVTAASGNLGKAIKDGVYNIPSDYKKASGRDSKSVIEMMQEFKRNK